MISPTEERIMSHLNDKREKYSEFIHYKDCRNCKIRIDGFSHKVRNYCFWRGGGGMIQSHTDAKTCKHFNPIKNTCTFRTGTKFSLGV